MVTRRQAPKVKKVKVGWRDKIGKAMNARAMGKELRKGKKHYLSTTPRTSL